VQRDWAWGSICAHTNIKTYLYVRARFRHSARIFNTVCPRVDLLIRIWLLEVRLAGKTIIARGGFRSIADVAQIGYTRIQIFSTDHVHGVNRRGRTNICFHFPQRGVRLRRRIFLA